MIVGITIPDQNSKMQKPRYLLSPLPTVNPSGGAAMAFCFPDLWSCTPETCTSYNFTIPNGQLVIRDDQKPGLGMGASGQAGNSTVPSTVQATTTLNVSSTTDFSIVTVERTPFATATITTTPIQMVTKSALAVRSAIVGITVGIPLLIIAIVAFLIIVWERWKYKGLLDENKKLQAKNIFYKGLTPVSNKDRLQSWYELSPGALQLAEEMCTGPVRAGWGNGESQTCLTPAKKI